MAKLKGQLPLKGTIQNITFAETSDGIIAKSKSSLNRKRLTEDASFERTREQNRELAETTSAGKLIRQALDRTVFFNQDRADVNRLTSRLTKVMKSDRTNGRGKRKVSAGILSLLKGFEFNSESMVSQRLLQQPVISYDRITGILQAYWSAFLPDCMLDVPKEATHVQLVLTGALIDFNGKTFHTQHIRTEILPLHGKSLPELALTTQLSANSADPLIVTLGIEWLELINHVYCPLDRGKQNGMVVAEVLT